MNASNDVGKLILRVSIGAMMLLHGLNKLSGIDFIMGKFTEMGLPGFLGYSVYLGEIIAPLMLIVGFRSRIAGLLIAATMVIATMMVHSGDVFTRTKTGAWGIELQALYFFGGLAIYYLGGGKYSLSRMNRWD